MNDLLQLVLDAHGGLERWRQVRRLTVHAHVGGELWGRRGQEGILTNAHLELDPHAGTTSTSSTLQATVCGIT